MLVEKAIVLHKFLSKKDPDSVRDCGYSNGWLEGFYHRHNIKLYAFHSKAESTVRNHHTWDLFASLKAVLSSYV